MEGQPILPPGTPSHQQQQWGVIISIVIIVMMIVVGAFYAWGQRIAEQNALNAATSATTTGQ
ncbi:MAG: hypothetical protein RLZZ26_77 [Candidatus Parcubacteria bacterium]|jgi:hypothetical protein